jgi:SAM-dependent methyltransferase
MPENNDFWNFYWEMRLQPMENLGKRVAILAASRLIRDLSQQLKRPLRLLELGCGEGQVIGTLLDAHSQLCPPKNSVGVDYNPKSLANCHRDFASMQCVAGDFTDPKLLGGLGQFEIVLLVNALHEVFSATFSTEQGEIDIPLAKQRVEQALAGAVSCLAPDGWLVLFDGLEPPGDPRQTVRVRFCNRQARRDFETFAKQYHPLRISYRSKSDPLCIELSQRDFTRYITKSIFLTKKLWLSERFESYQYFTEAEYRAAFARQSLNIMELRTLTVNEEKWRRLVTLEGPGAKFPEEHILILARPAG